MAEFMRSRDAFTWAMERDPRLRSTVVTVLWLDHSPDWDYVRDRIDLLTRRLPMFRQRVVTSPPPAPPRWEDDPDFDLDFHLRRVSAPEPGDLDVVLEMARIAATGDFDRARPLWTVTLVDRLADDEAVVLCKFHHCLTDGVGGVQIGQTLFDPSPRCAENEPLPPLPRAVGAPWPKVGWDVLGYGAGSIASAATDAITSAPRLIYTGLRHPMGAIESVSATASSIYRTIRPITSTGSTLMKNRSLTRRLGVYDVPMPRLRDAAHVGGGALNDGFVAGLAGGLRRYHERHGVEVEDLHITMPINLRVDGDAMGGNRITLMRFDVPVGMTDPAARIGAIHSRTGRVRREPSLPYTQAIAAALNLMPRWYIGSVLRHVDFVASDVPGIPVPVYLGGALVRRQYAFGPTIGSAVNVTLLTYVDICGLGIDVDGGAIPDYDVFHECLVDGFDEVLALAG